MDSKYKANVKAREKMLVSLYDGDDKPSQDLDFLLFDRVCLTTMSSGTGKMSLSYTNFLIVMFSCTRSVSGRSA